MNTTMTAGCCPKCQTTLPSNAPQGLCAKCLLAAASKPTEIGQNQKAASGAVPPPLETVSAAFPQLEILELIGHGGMGVVYKARQPKLDRLVALKLLTQSLARDPAFAERFNREARFLARLNHPSIVNVYDYGEAGGFYYLLMEYVDGVNLRQAMQAGRFTPAQALALVPKICDALQFAHNEGVLHRDVKPENILLDLRGRVKMADFGIAKLVGDCVPEATLTANGQTVGTPHYMAPEQWEHPQEVDQRADIYSLGVVFYEMLTGELPVGRFAPPSEKTPVDPRVDAVVFRALEKEREKRFDSAAEVKSRVEAITATPAAAAPVPLPDATGSAPHTATNSVPPNSASADTAFEAGVPSATPSPAEWRSACYYSTPEQMRNCFPGPTAQIFICRGELHLNGQNLTFTAPCRPKLVIGLKTIQDLTFGRFQMETRPWFRKTGKLTYLVVTYGEGGLSRTLHLAPVGPGQAAAETGNSYISRWYERIHQGIIACTGQAPNTALPDGICISAERAWARKGHPLFLAGGCVLGLAVGLWRSGGHSAHPLALVALVGGVLLFGTGLVFGIGFTRADRALKRGDWDAVTIDVPPGEPLMTDRTARRDPTVAMSSPGLSPENHGSASRTP